MQKTKRFIGAKIAAVIIGIVFILVIPVTPRLSIEHNGVAVLFIDVKDGENFIIRYTHSVNRSDVDDTIERSGSRLIVRSSLFQSFGAGIPVADDRIQGRNAGTSLTKTEDGLLLDGIDTVYYEINLLTGTYSNHRIISRNRQYILKEIVGEQQVLKIQIKHVSLLQLIIT